MKYLFLALGLFVSVIVNAQFGVYAKAGTNYSQLYITRGEGEQNGQGGFGWQAGGGVEYYTQFGFFLYLGVDLASESFKKDSSGIQGLQSVVSEYSYKPLFINFPLGIAYQFSLAKTLGLKVYGGLTTQVGVGGNVSQRTSYYSKDTTTGTFVKVREQNDTHKIQYGKNSTKDFRFDLSNTNWGFNIGAGLNFNKSAEISLLYQRGFTNILPGKDAAPEVNKLGLIQLDLKLYFPKQYYKPQQKR